ncbi:helix-turn-helix domain-containing protein [Ruminiclostridium cellulolyticum]|uniref:Helix-turn-helix domain-containing protein n=1 Tax=Ruminiclostridium cellulolyticum (strain ATCC 35319 / DSM 5812 / JCM 6584 / H10) TaxID=394503 RepID=B8I351_RUMCH|nr:helix-turn-helix domain-containing protein [Ruminiclostridium cellulolyticum]ACL76194.1 conserved hypothetical protein [Ruminiclostridium cellulolyticum H10]
MATTKMRTVEQTVAYFKENDPQTAVNPTMLRSLLKQGKIKFVKIGAKYLINVDWFEEWLKNPVMEENIADKNQYGKLRKI